MRHVLIKKCVCKCLYPLDFIFNNYVYLFIGMKEKAKIVTHLRVFLNVRYDSPTMSNKC